MAVWDLANSDCIVTMGSNMAENHPIAFRFAVEAQRRGATLIHVDPALHPHLRRCANIHAPIRSGSDIAFLGGIIHQILERDLWFRDFAMAYTNIANIIEDGYQRSRTERRRVLRLRRRNRDLQAGHLAVPRARTSRPRSPNTACRRRRSTKAATSRA